jgi:hypothetical protein
VVLYDRRQTPAPGVENRAEDMVLDAIGTVLVDHLRDRVKSAPPERDCAPILIQVDGPGKSEFLGRLGRKLDPLLASRHQIARNRDWTAVRFDAWQYQRLSPPWWWLMSAIDKQIRARCRARGRRFWLRQRWQDMRYRALCLGRDLLWVIPGAGIFLLGWHASGHAALQVLKWVLTAAGGIAATVALLSSIRNALTRHLLAESPRGTQALLRTTDPMEELLRRYGFLIRSASTPIVVLIDNLDRCHAQYVVEFLEGIQTLLRNLPNSKRWPRPTPRRRPLVAFVVAADRDWLAESYVRVYREFKGSAREPGRPFGLAFVERIFECALRLPTVPAAVSLAARAEADHRGSPDPFAQLEQELDIRRELARCERSASADRGPSNAPLPMTKLRAQAVERLGAIHLQSLRADRLDDFDTRQQLEQLLADLDPGPVVQRQLETAYCVNRATQLLAGHAVDADDDAIYRLGLWTLLELRWPLLANHLTRCPHDLEHIAREGFPDGFDAELGQVFTEPVARRLTHRVLDGKLLAEDIERFTTPLPRLSVTTLASPRVAVA